MIERFFLALTATFGVLALALTIGAPHSGLNATCALIMLAAAAGLCAHRLGRRHP